ncbi:MAG: dockerin type I repeat-containing protein, partial [Clostridia bacterium]|nr:dockerin type I repeat-containing protein [Clostridia bacterium]
VMDFEVTKFSLDPSEIEISVIYADGSTVSYKGIDIVESVDSDGFFGAIKSPYGRIDVSVGKQQNSYGEVIYYYVNLGNLGTQIDGTVIIESIEINTLPDKTDYESDEELDVRGLTIKVNYSDGSSTVIDEGYRVSVDEGLAGSGKVVNINYAGHTASFKTTVSGEKVYGDANLDGIVDIDDLVAFKKVLLGAESENDNCDVNGDGNVNILDFIRMKKHLSENAPLGPDNTVTVTTEVAMVAENKNTVA